MDTQRTTAPLRLVQPRETPSVARVVRALRSALPLVPSEEAVAGLRHATLVALAMVERMEAAEAAVTSQLERRADAIGLQSDDVRDGIVGLVCSGLVEASEGILRFSPAATEVRDSETLPLWGEVFSAVEEGSATLRAPTLLGFWAYIETWRVGRGRDGWAMAPVREIEELVGYRDDTLRKVRTRLTDLGLAEFHVPAGGKPRVRPGPRAFPHLFALPPGPAVRPEIVASPPTPTDIADREMWVVFSTGRVRAPFGARIEVGEGQTMRHGMDPDGTLVVYVEDRR